MKFILDKSTEIAIVNGYHGLEVELDDSDRNAEEMLTVILDEKGLDILFHLLNNDDDSELFDYLQKSGALHNLLESNGYIFNKG